VRRQFFFQGVNDAEQVVRAQEREYRRVSVFAIPRPDLNPIGRRKAQNGQVRIENFLGSHFVSRFLSWFLMSAWLSPRVGPLLTI
jgi:hypothetical protein